jgi:hypothetical protein
MKINASQLCWLCVHYFSFLNAQIIYHMIKIHNKKRRILPLILFSVLPWNLLKKNPDIAELCN